MERSWTLDRAFAKWCLDGRVRQAEAVGGRLLRSGSQDCGNDADPAVPMEVMTSLGSKRSEDVARAEPPRIAPHLPNAL